MRPLTTHSDSSNNSDDDSENSIINPDESIFQLPKCKWTKDKFVQAVQKGEITPFYPPSPNKTLLNDICCGICYQFFPRINKITCCNFVVCSNCLIFLEKCPVCKKEISIKANCTSNQILKYDEDINQKSYPDDTLEIAQEFGLDTRKVKKLLDSGFKIDELFHDDEYTC
ncbi:hypothetical protein M9Y10_011954 [Tritrichomonas musculus]|uniref:RING-type domain-containing protein n=1 Tax=Tritrichomonas musculus TaxID=1915356 RepID=A0ABR2IBC8_9EUKA